jgi:hypothetical protein
MFGFSIGASKMGLGEYTESNELVCEVSTKYGIVNHDQVIQWFMSIPSKYIFLQTYHSEKKV